MSATNTDSKAFRNALGQFATGVTIITALDADGKKAGMTANSFSSVSLDPMLVLWSIAKTSRSFDVFMQAKQFAIHVLHAEQRTLSSQFSSNCDDRFNAVSHRTGLGGIPILDDYAAVFQCETECRHEGGDHVIILGRVIEFDNRGKAPLVFHAGRYMDLELPVAV